MPTDNDIAIQIKRILASRLFLRSERLCRFVRFAANHALSGNGQRLKEYLVGVEVFDRGPDYDPRIDPIVRVEARRLRAKLKSYYASAGRDDQLRIEFPKGTYSPVFRFRSLQRVKLKSPDAAIAVLPFESLTNSTPNESFGDGLTEELIHHLAQVPGLQIVLYNGGSRTVRRGESLQFRSDVTRWNMAIWGSSGIPSETNSPLDTWREWASDVRGFAIDCGHYLPEENPQATAKALNEFFL